MKLRVVVAGLAIVLGMAGVGAIGFTDGAVAQTVDARKVEADTLRLNEAERLLTQGINEYETSQYDASLQSCQQALNIYIGIKNRQGQGKSIRCFGVINHFLGNYPKAIQYFEKSLAITHEIKDRQG